jgi:2-polyprenyl-6-methoxyphenol hydroxylase-like FAD-dependent oxidoreductase
MTVLIAGGGIVGSAIAINFATLAVRLLWLVLLMKILF